MNSRPSQLVSRCVAIAVLATAAFLGGCQISYTLGVKNATDQPVTVSVVQSGPTGLSQVVASKWLGPGDSATLGPGVTEKSARVELVADSKANEYAPAAVQVEPGWTSYDITRRGSGKLVLVRRD